MTIPERINAIINYYGLNAQRFADKIGAKTKQAVYNLLYGRTRSISDTMRDNILAAFPDVSPSWLMTGQGAMLLSQETPPQDSVPLIPFSASAGSFSDTGAASIALRDCERVAAPVAGCDIAIDVYGDSMEPQFPSGCRVFVQRVNPETFIAWGNVYLLDTTNGAYIKRVFPAENADAILAKSDNPAYPPFDIPKKAVIGMYRVVFMGRSFTTN